MLSSSSDLLLFMDLSQGLTNTQDTQACLEIFPSNKLYFWGAEDGTASALPPPANNKSRSPHFPLKAGRFTYFNVNFYF